MPRPTKSAVHPRDMVLTALRQSEAPLTAYRLLEELSPFGVRSAPIVYRALGALEQAGKVHKIRALGAYVACNCAEDHSHHLSVLTLCRKCKAVEERHDAAVIDYVGGLRKLRVNLPENAVVELPVICDACSTA